MRALWASLLLLGASTLSAAEYYCQTEFYLGFNSQEDGTATTYRLLSDNRYILNTQQEQLSVFRPNDDADLCASSFHDWEVGIFQCLRKSENGQTLMGYVSFNPKNLKFSVMSLERVGYETLHGGLCRRVEGS